MISPPSPSRSKPGRRRPAITPTLTLRVPPKLLARLTRAAVEAEQSRHAYILGILRKWGAP